MKRFYDFVEKCLENENFLRIIIGILAIWWIVDLVRAVSHFLK